MSVHEQTRGHFSIYPSEVGSYALGGALSDRRLHALCRESGDPSGSLKLFVSTSPDRPPSADYYSSSSSLVDTGYTRERFPVSVLDLFSPHLRVSPIIFRVAKEFFFFFSHLKVTTIINGHFNSWFQGDNSPSLLRHATSSLFFCSFIRFHQHAAMNLPSHPFSSATPSLFFCSFIRFHHTPPWWSNFWNFPFLIL